MSTNQNSNNVQFSSHLYAYRAKIILVSLFLTSLVSFVVACSIGSVSLSFPELLHAVLELAGGGSPGGVNTVLLELRLYRALSAFVTGAALALSGVLMQALLRNPLADPYVLGVSGGAAIGALSAMLVNAAVWIINLAAFGGAIGVTGLLFFLAYRDFIVAGCNEGRAPTLLLSGVIIGSGCMALITLILSVTPDSQLRSMVFWLMGDLSDSGVSYFPWIVLIGVLIVVCIKARSINIAALYSDNASTLGISVGRLRKILFIFAALLTASAVSNAGSIGFVGLIMPHACRLAWGSDHRLLLPASCLAGGSFLMLADTMARTVLSPQQLPVGVITALIGVPLFLLQLHRHRSHE
jgi:iron complex transport system permease protein